MEKEAFTVALGKKSYKKMALNLARSLEYNSKSTNFTIFSDEPLPTGGLRRTSIKIIDPTKYGVGFSVKLNLDKISPSEKSLFIDADCLVYRDLEPIFSAFQGVPVGVFGVTKYDGEMFCDVSSVCRTLNLSGLPHFNGGIYYIEKGAAASSVYDRARGLEPRYDQLGLVRLRGQPNDEILMSIALAEHGIAPLENNGQYYSDFQWWPEVINLNVIRKISRMRNPDVNHYLHQSKFPAKEACGAVVHFLGHHVESSLYDREALALRILNVLPAPDLFATLAMSPRFASDRLKDILRPAYRKIFGVRPIRRTDSRLIVD